MSKRVATKLIADKFLQIGYNSNPEKAIEAKELADNFIKSFGIFVGFYNKINNTAFTVEQAIWEVSLIQQYEAAFKAARVSKEVNNYPDAPKRVQSKSKIAESTKLTSLKQFKKEHANNTYDMIFTAIAKSPCPVSRSDIAKVLDIRVSTVCGQVARLLEDRKVVVCGLALDTESNRTVEVLMPAKGSY